MTSLRSLAVAAALAAGLAGAAVAQPAPAPAPTPAAPTAVEPAPTAPTAAQPAPTAVEPAPTAAQPAQPAATADGKPPPYQSQMRAQCGAELRKDLSWQADIDSYCDTRAHEKSAASIQRNERHVFIAYAVIWVLLAGLVGFMWLRQGRLNAEIKRLEDELRRIEQADQKAAP